MHAPGPRILIVDDSEDDTLLATARLKRALPGVAVRRVDSPESMRSALDGDDWDLVISDHAMPRFDSLGALEVLKSSGKAIPFIVYSGHYDRDQGLEALRAGVRDFVQKNDPGRLVPVVQKSLTAPAEGDFAGGARLDPVTGLAGRHWLLDQLDAGLAAWREGEARLALLRVDLDRFQRINRAFGTVTGDRLMADVAFRLKRELAACDLLARGDDDEFLCLVDRTADASAAQRRGERVLRSLDEPFVRDGNTFYVTASAGLALHPLHGANALALHEAAGRGVERARAIGINRVAIAPEPRVVTPASLAPGAVVPADELFVLAHPIVALATGRTWGVEAGVRRRHTGLAVLSPDPDSPIVPERPGVATVGQWLLDESLRLVERLRQGGVPEGRVAVNLPRSLLFDARLADDIAETLARAGQSPDGLEIEIPERWILAEPGRAEEAARRLRAAGLRLALDEFGTNYGPLAPLQRLAVDTLKLAPALVRESRQDESGEAALRGALALARAMGAAVVAVGVESVDDGEWLAELGVDRAQGPAYPPRRIETAPLLPARFDRPAAADAARATG